MAGRDHEAWAWLLAALDEWGSAAQVAPGRIEVVLPDSGRRVVVVMTPEEWDEDVAGVGFGSARAGFEHVKETLLGLQPHESFAVYSQYRLQPCAAPSLPEVDDRPTGPGGWFAHDRDGQVVSRFSEWRDPTDDVPPADA